MVCQMLTLEEASWVYGEDLCAAFVAPTNLKVKTNVHKNPHSCAVLFSCFLPEHHGQPVCTLGTLSPDCCIHSALSPAVLHQSHDITKL